MDFVFKDKKVESDFLDSFIKKLYFKLKNEGFDIDKHDPILNPFAFDETVYSIEDDSLESLVDVYFHKLLHDVFADDDLEDAIFESTMANHG